MTSKTPQSALNPPKSQDAKHEAKVTAASGKTTALTIEQLRKNLLATTFGGRRKTSAPKDTSRSTVHRNPEHARELASEVTAVTATVNQTTGGSENAGLPTDREDLCSEARASLDNAFGRNLLDINEKRREDTLLNQLLEHKDEQQAIAMLNHRIFLYDNYTAVRELEDQIYSRYEKCIEILKADVQATRAYISSNSNEEENDINLLLEDAYYYVQGLDELNIILTRLEIKEAYYRARLALPKCEYTKEGLATESAELTQLRHNTEITDDLTKLGSILKSLEGKLAKYEQRTKELSEKEEKEIQALESKVDAIHAAATKALDTAYISEEAYKAKKIELVQYNKAKTESRTSASPKEALTELITALEKTAQSYQSFKAMDPSLGLAPKTEWQSEEKLVTTAALYRKLTSAAAKTAHRAALYASALELFKSIVNNIEAATPEGQKTSGILKSMLALLDSETFYQPETVDAEIDNIKKFLDTAPTTIQTSLIQFLQTAASHFTIAHEFHAAGEALARVMANDDPKKLIALQELRNLYQPPADAKAESFATRLAQLKNKKAEFTAILQSALEKLDHAHTQADKLLGDLEEKAAPMSAYRAVLRKMFDPDKISNASSAEIIQLTAQFDNWKNYFAALLELRNNHIEAISAVHRANLGDKAPTTLNSLSEIYQKRIPSCDLLLLASVPDQNTVLPGKGQFAWAFIADAVYFIQKTPQFSCQLAFDDSSKTNKLKDTMGVKDTLTANEPARLLRENLPPENLASIATMTGVTPRVSLNTLEDLGHQLVTTVLDAIGFNPDLGASVNSLSFVNHALHPNWLSTLNLVRSLYNKTLPTTAKDPISAKAHTLLITVLKMDPKEKILGAAQAELRGILSQIDTILVTANSKNVEHLVNTANQFKTLQPQSANVALLWREFIKDWYVSAIGAMVTTNIADTKVVKDVLTFLNKLDRAHLSGTQECIDALEKIFALVSGKAKLDEILAELNQIIREYSALDCQMRAAPIYHELVTSVCPQDAKDSKRESKDHLFDSAIRTVKQEFDAEIRAAKAKDEKERDESEKALAALTCPADFTDDQSNYLTKLLARGTKPVRYYAGNAFAPVQNNYTEALELRLQKAAQDVNAEPKLKAVAAFWKLHNAFANLPFNVSGKLPFSVLDNPLLIVPTKDVLATLDRAHPQFNLNLDRAQAISDAFDETNTKLDELTELFSETESLLTSAGNAGQDVSAMRAAFDKLQALRKDIKANLAIKRAQFPPSISGVTGTNAAAEAKKSAPLRKSSSWAGKISGKIFGRKTDAVSSTVTTPKANTPKLLASRLGTGTSSSAPSSPRGKSNAAIASSSSSTVVPETKQERQIPVQQLEPVKVGKNRLHIEARLKVADDADKTAQRETAERELALKLKDAALTRMGQADYLRELDATLKATVASIPLQSPAMQFFPVDDDELQNKGDSQAEHHVTHQDSADFIDVKFGDDDPADALTIDSSQTSSNQTWLEQPKVEDTNDRTNTLKVRMPAAPASASKVRDPFNLLEDTSLSTLADNYFTAIQDVVGKPISLTSESLTVALEHEETFVEILENEAESLIDAEELHQKEQLYQHEIAFLQSAVRIKTDLRLAAHGSAPAIIKQLDDSIIASQTRLVERLDTEVTRQSAQNQRVAQLASSYVQQGKFTLQDLAPQHQTNAVLTHFITTKVNFHTQQLALTMMRFNQRSKELAVEQQKAAASLVVANDNREKFQTTNSDLTRAYGKYLQAKTQREQLTWPNGSWLFAIQKFWNRVTSDDGNYKKWLNSVTASQKAETEAQSGLFIKIKDAHALLPVDANNNTKKLSPKAYSRLLNAKVAGATQSVQIVQKKVAKFREDESAAFKQARATVSSDALANLIVQNLDQFDSALLVELIGEDPTLADKVFGAVAADDGSIAILLNKFDAHQKVVIYTTLADKYKDSVILSQWRAKPSTLIQNCSATDLTALIASEHKQEQQRRPITNAIFSDFELCTRLITEQSVTAADVVFSKMPPPAKTYLAVRTAFTKLPITVDSHGNITLNDAPLTESLLYNLGYSLGAQNQEHSADYQNVLKNDTVKRGHQAAITTKTIMDAQPDNALPIKQATAVQGVTPRMIHS